MIWIQSVIKQVDAAAWRPLLWPPLLFVLAVLTLELYHWRFINFLPPFSFFRWSVLLLVTVLWKFSVSDFTASVIRFKIFPHTLCIIYFSQNLNRRSGAAGCAIPLQSGESRIRFPIVFLEFFLDINLRAKLRPWDRLSLWQKWELRWLMHRVDDRTTFLNSGSLSLLEPSESVQICTALSVPYLYLEPCFYSYT